MSSFKLFPMAVLENVTSRVPLRVSLYSKGDTKETGYVDGRDVFGNWEN